MEYGSKFGIWLIEFSDRSPLFKGPSLMLLGLLALGFAWWMKKRWKEPPSFGYYLFAGVAAFIFLYGLLILILRPEWWKLPY